ncbi:MAG: hypothetical protein ACXACY_18865 [Candidatus Hodarchaeales archaeon]|jgi:hypothetical protein
MKKSKPSGKISEKIARAFAIMFNRATMYKMGHPFTDQSIQEVYNTVTDGLEISSPVALILNREQFFVEEEPFDQRLNTSRMAAHFKKGGIQSVSFQKGMSEDELKNFVEIFVDPASYPKASLMKKALAGRMVANVKINHVFYKKMTADDEIVSKGRLKETSNDTQNNTSAQMYGEVLNMMAESVLREEIEKSFSLKNLLADPIKLSNDLIDKDLVEANGEHARSSNHGPFISGQLMRIRDEISKIKDGVDDINLSGLADAVYDMRDELLKGIKAQKALGVIYENEKQIIDEANALTDQILIQLVRKEYQEGKISTERLAQILRRMVPEPAELKRLLPKIKNALLEEGMSMTEFLELIDALGKELHNEELVEIFRKSAEEVGLASEDLIHEFKMDPSGAAELIYLASELRKGTGDEKILTELLVEYIERIGGKIVLDTTEQNDNAGGDHLKRVITEVETEIVSKLNNKGIDDDVLNTVQDKLMERMEMCFNKLKEEWQRRHEAASPTEEKGQTTIFQILEESVGEGDKLNEILKQVRTSINEGVVDENNFHQIYKEITQIKKKKQQGKEHKKLPSGILTYKNTLMFIEKEISRSKRYETPFSVITFSIVKVEPKQPIPKGTIPGHGINKSIMCELVKISRDADLIGILTKKILIVLLPMTGKEKAKIAVKRILKSLHAEPISVRGMDLKVQLAGAVTSFDNNQSPDLESFLKIAENDHNEFLIRLRNIQDLY